VPEKLMKIPDDKDRPIPARVYNDATNSASDFIVIFGDQYWHAVGSIGLNTLLTFDHEMMTEAEAS
jgi:hypothetical protein